MTIRCDGCRHWRPLEDDDSECVHGIGAIGECIKAIAIYDYNKRDHAGHMLFCMDAEDYHASVWTRPAFFCAYHEPVKPKEDLT